MPTFPESRTSFPSVTRKKYVPLAPTASFRETAVEAEYDFANTRSPLMSKRETVIRELSTVKFRTSPSRIAKRLKRSVSEGLEIADVEELVPIFHDPGTRAAMPRPAVLI